MSFHASLPIVALMTDFGSRDGFAGIVKGVIYRTIQSLREPRPPQPHPAQPPVIDISHDIEPQNIHQAAWVLNNCYRDFPEHTVFVCVIDPKVGESAQRGLLLYWPERHQYFIAPDNGLLTPVIQAAGDNRQAWYLENTSYFRESENFSGRKLFADQGPPEISHTFHGRDIYAPVAGHLANALIRFMAEEFLLTVGSRADNPTQIPWPEASRTEREIEGHVMHVDTFGNLITNIPNGWVSPDQMVTIEIARQKWQARRMSSYAQGEGSDHVFIVPSSSGCLELTLYRQSAARKLDARTGDGISLIL